MAAIESSSNAKVGLIVDPTHNAGRVSLRPLEHAAGDVVGGHYSLALTSPAQTVLTAGDIVLGCRWTDVQRKMWLKRIRAIIEVSTAFGAAQELGFYVSRVSGYSVVESSGGAAITADQISKADAAMAPSKVNLYYANGATAITGGTGTSETYPIARADFPGLLNVVGSMAAVDLYSHQPGVDHPQAFNPNEGFRIRVAVTEGATGVVNVTFVLDWAELPRSLSLAA